MENNMEQEQVFAPCWAIVEVFGHQRFAGLVGEQPIAGDKMLRLDIPATPESRVRKSASWHPITGERGRFRYDEVRGEVGAETKFFGVKAIYALTPCTEEAARTEAARLAVRSAVAENVVEISQTLIEQGADIVDAEDEADGDQEDDDAPF